MLRPREPSALSFAVHDFGEGFSGTEVALGRDTGERYCAVGLPCCCGWSEPSALSFAVRARFGERTNERCARKSHYGVGHARTRSLGDEPYLGDFM